MTRPWYDEFPRVVADLNLDIPALIEASAGTGKTYAIEHLVLRLVAEKPDWKFESLLLLSFTEKTASDLRKRIRERLKTESFNLFWTAQERARFFEAHLRCDEASIHTLHGFCHAVLRAHALENGTLFDADVAQDRELLNDALDGLLRGPWAHDEARLRELLDALSSTKNWQNHLVSIALAYQPGRGDSLHPLALPNQLQILEDDLQENARILYARFQNFSGKFSKNIFLRLRDRIDTLASQNSGSQTKSLTEFFLKLRANNKAVKEGFAAALAKTAAKDPQWVELAETCQRFYNAAKNWQEGKRKHSLGLIAVAVRELRERLAWEKKRHGVLSYDDMVLRLVEALRVRPALVEQLREKYRACVVDEFQDTDPLQWELLERLCLQGENGPPLFLVGDPKQAIYGFRGGDLRTYLEARSRLHEMSVHQQAQGAGLKENFRSQPDLIHALNAVFAQPNWFGLSESSEASVSWKLPPQSDRIPFTPATIPMKTKIAADANPCVVLRDFSEYGSKSETQKSVHQWIASEIRNVVSGVGVENFSPQPLPVFNDIAILTRTNPEAANVEKYLRRQGIPCRVRRRGGIFDSVQADQIRLLLSLLETVNDPKSQAQILLLPFLRGFEGRWPQGLPERCPDLIRQWAALADAGKWPEFFHSLLYETGFIYRLSAETRGGSEVQIALTLARRLTEEGSQQGHSLRGLLQRFDALRREEEDAPNETYDDGAEDRVTIMTLHMSKGLEFPFVFLASLSDNRKPAFYTLRGERGFEHVLDKEDARAVQLYEQQMLEEDKRLFYVGFTRAKTRLYLPLLPEKFSHARSGPLGGFAAEALRKADETHSSLFRFDREPLPFASRMNAVDPANAGAEVPFPEKDPWEEAGAFFNERRRKLSSYSQLLKREAATVVEEDGRRVNKEEGELIESVGFEIALIESKVESKTVSATDLPPGAHTGNALHELFETVDFSALARFENTETLVEDVHLLELAKNVLRDHGLAEEYAATALSLVWNTLRMPLPDPAGGKPFQLATILDRKHEMEFLLPFDGLKGNSSLPAGVTIRNGFLWGFMDLIFRHEERYYLLDWKSNLLERYGGRDIEADMQKHRYDLQYQLYAVALDKWLQTRLPDYHPGKNFGGIFYLYLRGASQNTFSGFSKRPSLDELRETYPARLNALLGLKAEASA